MSFLIQISTEIIAFSETLNVSAFTKVDEINALFIKTCPVIQESFSNTSLSVMSIKNEEIFAFTGQMGVGGVAALKNSILEGK